MTESTAHAHEGARVALPVRRCPTLCRIAIAVAFVAACAVSAPSHAGETTDGGTVASELWDRPRTARAVQADPAVRRAAQRLAAEPGLRLAIHHVRVQESLLQAEELRSWLVALAIDAARIALVPDLAPGSPIRLDVVSR
jgi:hypothetical protein